MNKKDKTILPKLRFLEFKDYPEWTIDEFGNLAVPVEERAGTKKYTLMSVTSGVGLVPQIEKFGREIAGSAYKNYYVIKKNDFAYNKSATIQFPEGYISMLTEYDEAALPNSIFTCFRITDEKCCPKFFDHLFHANYHGSWLRKYIQVGARAHGSLSIDTQHLWDMPVALPKLNEQQKIADCLSSLDDLITAEDIKLESLTLHKKGLMQKLFPAKGKTVPEWRFPEFRNSNEWKITSLGVVCDILQGYGFPTEMQGNPKGKYSFYKVSDISNSVVNSGGLLLKAVNCIGDTELLSLRAKTIPKGTTVFAKIGEALRLNRRAITTAECLIDNNVVGIKAKSKSTDDYFIFLLSQLIDLGKHCGGAVPSVNKATLENIEIPFTTISQEQQKIVDCLTSLDTLITVQTEKIETLKMHKRCLMQGMFPALEEVGV